MLACLVMLLCMIPAITAAADPSQANVKVDSYVKSTGVLTLSWDAAETEGYGVEELRINNRSYEVQPVGGSKLTATVPGLSSGSYNATLFFKQEGGGSSQPVDFKAVITLSVEEELGFDFKEDTTKRSFNSTTGVLTIYWNQEDAPAGTKITGIKLDGKTYTLAEGDTPKGQVNIAGLTNSKVEPGDYNFTFLFELPSGNEVELAAATPAHITGTIIPVMTVTVENKRIVATVTTPVKKRPVAGYQVILKTSSMELAPLKTDKNGKIVFSITVPENRKEVLCEGVEEIIDGITYGKCVGGLDEITVPTNPTTTPTGTPTTNPTTGTTQGTRPGTTSATTNATRETETETTYSLIQGAGTTGIEGDLVAVNVSYDTNILKTFGLRQADFDSRARMLLSKDMYQSLVGDGKSTIMLCMRSSSFGVNRDQISSAINGVSKYSTYDVDQIGAVVADFGLLYIDGEANTQTVLQMPEGAGEFVVQVPVPDSMKDIKLFAAAQVDSQGLGTLLDATIQDGYIRFTATSMGDFAILGFAEASGGNGQNDVPILLVVMIIIGVLLLAGAGFLIYFFIIRKPRDDDDDDLPPDDGLTTLAEDGGPMGPGEEGGAIPSNTVSDYVNPQPGRNDPIIRDAAADDRDVFSGATMEIDKAVPLVPMQDLVKDAPPVPRKQPPVDDGRDIYSSDSKRPGAHTADDVSLGSFQEPGQPPKRKNPSDYDIDL